MDNNSANPIIVALFFILRCLIPLLIMFGISYVLRRLGLIVPPPQEPDSDHKNAHV